MNSRERLLAALHCGQVDYLPCSVYFHPSLQVRGYKLTGRREPVRLAADLDTDPVINVHIGSSMHPEVRARVRVEQREGEKHPVLYKQYQTPAGTLRMGVRLTPQWPHGKDIPWDDFTAGHICEPLIKSPRDVDAFEYLCQPPTERDLAAAEKGNDQTRRIAAEYGIAVRGLAGQGLATLLFVMGAHSAVLFAVDHPGAFQRLAEIDHRTNLARIRLCARAGADFVKRFGGYEQTNLYSPAIFRRVVMPLLAEEVRVAHEVGLPIYYRVVTGMGPLLGDIASIGFDCIEGGEPRLSNCSLDTWRDAFAGKACSWTGISTPVLLGGSDPDAVRAEVRRCVEVFGRKGFILGVTNSIRNHFPWANTLAMIDEWKKVR